MTLPILTSVSGRSLITALLGGCAVLASTAANAEMHINLYDTLRKADERSTEFATLKMYIHGVSDGIHWVNATLDGERQRPLFCPPPTLKLTTENHMQIIDDTLRTDRTFLESNRVPIGAVLLVAMRKSFPCK